MPIKKFIYKDSAWREILIGTAKEGDNEAKTDNETRDKSKDDNFKLTYTLSAPNSISVQKYLDPERTFSDEKIEEGLSYEFSIERIKYFDNIRN